MSENSTRNRLAQALYLSPAGRFFCVNLVIDSLYEGTWIVEIDDNSPPPVKTFGVLRSEIQNTDAPYLIERPERIFLNYPGISITVNVYYYEGNYYLCVEDLSMSQKVMITNKS